MRVAASAALAVLVLAGCSLNESSARAEKCADLFMESIEPDSQLSDAEARRYVKTTYCNRFAREGWVYPDGALRIDAQRWLVHGGSEICVTQSPGGPTETVPCEQLQVRESPDVIDCAMLRRTRRSEVRTYVAELQKDGPIACDDGTSLAALGVP